jgi:hypothetical protein
LIFWKWKYRFGVAALNEGRLIIGIDKKHNSVEIAKMQ